MGICIDMTKSTIGIKLKKANLIVEALHDLEAKKGGRLEFIPTGAISASNDLLEVMSTVRFPLKVDAENELLVIDYFKGEKIGDEHCIFEAIAPYVEPGYIEFEGDDDKVWRYIFKDGEVFKSYPSTTWNINENYLNIKDVLTEENENVVFLDNYDRPWIVCVDKKNLSRLTLKACDSYCDNPDISELYTLDEIVNLEFKKDTSYDDVPF